MDYNPLNGLYVEHFNEQDDYQENKALLEGHLAHGELAAIFLMQEQAEATLLALVEAGFEDATLAPLEHNGMRVTVSPGPRADEAERILDEHSMTASF